MAQNKFYHIIVESMYDCDIPNDFIKSLFHKHSRLAECETHMHFSRPKRYNGDYDSWRNYRDSLPNEEILKEWPHWISFECILCKDDFIKLCELHFKRGEEIRVDFYLKGTVEV